MRKSKNGMTQRISKVAPKIEPVSTVKEVETPTKRKKLTVTRIVCSKCKTTKKTTKVQMDKLTAKFGSLEAVHDKYHCIECRKKYNVRKDGKPKPVKNTRKPKKDFSKGLPEWMTVKKDPEEQSTSTSTSHAPAMRGTFYWKKPEGVSDKKWGTVIREVVDWGTKQGILIPCKTNTLDKKP